jgi:hypothetical protein
MIELSISYTLSSICFITLYVTRTGHQIITFPNRLKSNFLQVKNDKFQNFISIKFVLSDFFRVLTSNHSRMLYYRIHWRARLWVSVDRLCMDVWTASIQELPLFLIIERQIESLVLRGSQTSILICIGSSFIVHYSLVLVGYTDATQIFTTSRIVIGRD